MGNLRKKGIALLKIAFSALLLYFIFNQIAFREVWEVVQGSHPGFLLGALFFFILSKWVSALRLNRYFREIGLPLSAASNLRLYLLGMFYNLFLPGGIGGDAYKGYALHRSFGSPVKKLVAVLLLDRISGMYLLFAYSCLLLLWLDLPWLAGYGWGLWLLLPGSLLVYFLLHRRFFGYVMPVFWRAAAYSALVQLGQLASAYCILQALGVGADQLPYLLLFLISSIVAVLPFTIGGIGSRELVFYYGALWLQLQEGTSLAVSMLFFGITALVSLCGIFYHFRKPALRLDPTSGPREA